MFSNFPRPITQNGLLKYIRTKKRWDEIRWKDKRKDYAAIQNKLANLFTGSVTDFVMTFPTTMIDILHGTIEFGVC